MRVPPAEPRTIAVRAYADPPTPPAAFERRAGRPSYKPLGPSAWTLIFDTETSTNAAQQLRVGAYQLRKGRQLVEQGLFYDRRSLTATERRLLAAYAERHGLVLMSTQEFVETVFFGKAYAYRALICGFNLPFDLSRLALRWSAARAPMRGGFSLQLSPHRWWPRIQVRHLNRRTSLIRFTVPAKQRRTRGERRRKLPAPAARRGFFCDVRTLASALYGGSHSLASLAKLLDTAHQKLNTEEHGGPLSAAYLNYLLADVQVTYECLRTLRVRFCRLGLTETRIDRVYSEASIGKGLLRQMGIRPWRELACDFPPSLSGIIMSAYYGGRAEVRLRRKITPVLYCDFRSMYPTVSSRLGLWEFVRAERVVCEEATEEVRAFLAAVSLEDLRRPETWRKLNVLVRVRPKADLLPIRARYGSAERPQYSTGLNYLSSNKGHWYTLADALVAKLLGGKVPRIDKALRFSACGVQDGLQPIELLDDATYTLDPERDDLYRRLALLRAEAKRRGEQARERGDANDAARAEAEQQALKVTANSSCYGIFLELRVVEHAKRQRAAYFGYDGKRRQTRIGGTEEPGAFFHPLLATLTTGGARLLLGIAERLAADQGIGWAFCDTDSMALACPSGMAWEEFVSRAERVRSWFADLDPCPELGELFKCEAANYALDESGRTTAELAPLFCLAVSTKRYVLFNVCEAGRPLLRKASGHGLGHLRAPYGPQDDSPVPAPPVTQDELGLPRWQHDVWYRIVEAALGGRPNQVVLDDLPGFDRPAMARYAATTPHLLSWFASYNATRSYRRQVRPFGFLLALQIKNSAQRLGAQEKDPALGVVLGALGELPRGIAPYDPDPAEAAGLCFDRRTGISIPETLLRTYAETLAQYHLHPEDKFADGDYLNVGETTRRHVRVASVEHIGKEANRWEERFFVGDDSDAQVLYGQPAEHLQMQKREALAGIRRYGVRRLARDSGLSLGLVSAMGQGRRQVSDRSVERIGEVLARAGWLPDPRSFRTSHRGGSLRLRRSRL